MAEEVLVPSHIGHFHITGGQINWPPAAGIGPVMPSRTLNVTLHVQPGSSNVTGNGTLSVTYPGKPVQYIRTHFHGTVHVLGYGVGKAFQIFSLQGAPVHPMPGAPFVSHLVIDLKNIWGREGTATYTYEIGGVEPISGVIIKDADVSARWLVKEGIPVLED
ncbi:hypothetical protein [Trinickia fusca]|uniref:DUF1842 domain-containing protein n=1 Tax=Trinickia fusca TaxID=2419777 RepID=A0A494X0N1_9BURK|nr:hypothetical protein [Trinickia fusca]RKP43890.1 hypothetical protein D7S89_24765 [Trinickia fusca]